LPMSVFYRDACSDISQEMNAVSSLCSVSLIPVKWFDFRISSNITKCLEYWEYLHRQTSIVFHTVGVIQQTKFRILGIGNIACTYHGNTQEHSSQTVFDLQKKWRSSAYEKLKLTLWNTVHLPHFKW
jgi:hypothetical protein